MSPRSMAGVIRTSLKTESRVMSKAERHPMIAASERLAHAQVWRHAKAMAMSQGREVYVVPVVTISGLWEVRSERPSHIPAITVSPFSSSRA